MTHLPVTVICQVLRIARVGDRFLALDDVTFDVEKGSALGIIGRNGAGKSTLLNIMSQVTAPTAGQITLRRRVASLLEVGTGSPGLDGTQESLPQWRNPRHEEG